MKNQRKTGIGQKGFSTPVIILIVGVVSLLLLAFFRVFPMWYGNIQIQTALDGIAQNEEVDARSKREIWGALQRQFYIDGIRYIERENVKISRKDGETTVLVQYEVKDTLIAPFFIGADFENQVVIAR